MKRAFQFYLTFASSVSERCRRAHFILNSNWAFVYRVEIQAQNLYVNYYWIVICLWWKLFCLFRSAMQFLMNAIEGGRTVCFRLNSHFSFFSFWDHHVIEMERERDRKKKKKTKSNATAESKLKTKVNYLCEYVCVRALLAANTKMFDEKSAKTCR